MRHHPGERRRPDRGPALTEQFPYREPGEPSPYTPYGQHPYGGALSGPSTDPVSITGFVLSLLCCTSIVGLVLGIVGVVRTKGGRRKGRWAAVSAIVVGAIGTIAGAAAVAGLIWVGATTVPEDEAYVGQCVDTSRFASTNDLWKAECDEEHDAEVVVAEELDATLVTRYQSSGDADFCASFDLRPEHRDALESGDFDVEIATDALSDEVRTGDHVVCFVQPSDGSKLDAPLGD